MPVADNGARCELERAIEIAEFPQPAQAGFVCVVAIEIAEFPNN